MTYLARPAGHDVECNCTDCLTIDAENARWIREGVAPCYCGSYTCDGNHPDSQPSVPFTPDLLVPLYDAPATPDQAGSDGWYRHFSSLIDAGEGSIPGAMVLMGRKDFAQLRHEIVSGSPVTATVTFRMVDDALVAQLVSYTAFA